MDVRKYTLFSLFIFLSVINAEDYASFDSVDAHIFVYNPNVEYIDFAGKLCHSFPIVTLIFSLLS